ncbi:MAG TPA: 5-(carboxyamino)imidazole ribonucleotide synthase [Acidimicrobiia bacterium]|nr:5-(carboxyamino)imidazole ribonucleotide synthase [Acidimicrobiia bacterium]
MDRNPTVVGVLGGGQLGRMLGLAGLPLGLTFRFLDPSPEAPAGAVGRLDTGALDDADAVRRVAEGADVVTYEWEGVDADAARAAVDVAPLRPGSRPLEIAQDRAAEKATFERLGIAVPPFETIDDRAGLDRAITRIGLPAVLKARRGGYDGKGQRVLRVATDVDDAWAALGDVPLIVERLVPFERELSIVAVRGLDGATACYPLVENEHQGGILRVTRAPASDLAPGQQADAEVIAATLLRDLDYVGVLAIELFEHDGQLLANELAPRVHNSGHWTIEGAETSQFENHLRAILGWPLGSVTPRGPSAMVNCLGEIPARAAVLEVAGAHLHDYGKTSRPGRKVGHVTVTADSVEERDRRLVAVRTVVDPG